MITSSEGSTLNGTGRQATYKDFTKFYTITRKSLTIYTEFYMVGDAKQGEIDNYLINTKKRQPSKFL